MSALGLDASSLLSIFVESVLWGVFVSLYFITVYLLLQRRSRIFHFIPRLLLVTLMLALCTIHISLSFRQCLDAFFLPNPLSRMNQNSRFKTCVHVIQVFMSDLLIVARTFYLWEQNVYVLILPLVLAAGTVVAGTGSLLTIFSLDIHSAPTMESQHWTIMFLILTLAAKAVCLLLVAFRVRHIRASITSYVNRHINVYTSVVVVVESGAAALVLCIVLLALTVVNSNAHYVIWDALSPVMGITVTTIVAGMAVKLSHPTNVPGARGVWDLFPPPLPSPVPVVRPPKAPWNQFSEVPPNTAGPKTEPLSPIDSHATSIQNMDKSTGTLNMGIVL